MIELDGVEYQVQDTGTIATEIVERINSYCTENNVTNSQGDIVYIDANRANPLYMIIWGISFLISILQRLVYNVGCAFNIAASSPRQLLNLADVANVKRNAATYTIIPCLVYASDEGDCLITKDLLLSTNVGGQEIRFHPAYETTIEKGQVLNIPMIAEVTGPYSIAGGWTNKFVSDVENLDHIVLADSIPGTEQETIAELRARMQRRRLNYTQIDAAKQAIMELPGIASCSIFFNYSNVDPATVGGIIIAPRKALVIVQGYSDDIAKTYYSHLLCESTPGPDNRTTEQDYITHANQHIPVYFVSPRTLNIFIDIIISGDIVEAVRNAMMDKACEISLHLNIGDSIDTFQIMELVSQTTGLDVSILGCSIGTSEETGLYQVTPEPDQLLILSPDNINIRVEE